MPDRAPDSSGAATSRLSRSAPYVIGGALVFGLLFALAAALAGGDDFLRHLGALSPGLLLGLLALSLVNYLARAVRWQLLCRRLDLAVPFPRNALYYVAGFSLTTTPGRVGEALRLWLLRRHHGYRYEATLALMIADRLSDTVAVVLLCLASVAAAAAYGWGVALAAALIGVKVVLLARPALLTRATGWLQTKFGLWPRRLAQLRFALRQTARLATWHTAGAALLLGIAGWLAEAGAFWWLLSALCADVSPIEAVFIFGFAMIVGGTMALPGGLGGTEATMVGLLAAFGVDLPTALAATAIIRATTLWFAVLLGLLALPGVLRPVRPAGVAAALGG
jgi:uncharacterized protein (TIRG00374 family)